MDIPITIAELEEEEMEIVTEDIMSPAEEAEVVTAMIIVTTGVMTEAMTETIPEKEDIVVMSILI